VNRCARQRNFAQSVNTRFNTRPVLSSPMAPFAATRRQARAGNYGFLSFYTDNTGAVARDA